MHIINITVRNKVAVNPAQDRYVCGNSDYIVRFDFDAEWDAFETKTARFVKEDGSYVDQLFSGNDCPVPVISDTYKLQVGVYAGNLSTTTAAYVPCKKSILCGGGVPAAPAEDVYNQIMEKLNSVPSMTGEPNMQLVSDKDGKAVWEERLAYKHVQSGTMTLFAEETLMDDPEDPGMYFSATPLAAMPEVGKTYDVTINGTVYNTTAHPKEEDGVQIAVVLGNTGNLDPEVYPDTGEPFMLFLPLPELQTMMGGMSVIMVTDIAADSITLSIKGQATITDIKKIDPEYLPSGKQIVLTVGSDGSITSDTDFETAWAMTPGELQSAIVIKESSNYKGETVTVVDNVSKAEGGVVGQMVGGRVITFNIHQPSIDTSDMNDRYITGFVSWYAGGIIVDQEKMVGLPIYSPTASAAYKGAYLRYDGDTWRGATIAQLKADIGHVTVRASQDVTLAISGIDKSFSDVLKALKNGAHVQLMLTRPDGFTEVYPAVGYADTNIAFIMLPSHDTAWAIEWTESGMTKILSGND